MVCDKTETWHCINTQGPFKENFNLIRKKYANKDSNGNWAFLALLNMEDNFAASQKSPSFSITFLRENTAMHKTIEVLVDICNISVWLYEVKQKKCNSHFKQKCLE